MSLNRSFLRLVLLAKIRLLYQALKTLLILLAVAEYLDLLVVDRETFGGLG